MCDYTSWARLTREFVCRVVLIKPLGVMLGTVLVFQDVKGCPSVIMGLPGSLRIGDRITLNLRLQRRNNGRTEVLEIKGDVRVTQTSLDATSGTPRQRLTVENAGVIPFVWKSVKNRPPWRRQLPPTHFPPTAVS